MPSAYCVQVMRDLLAIAKFLFHTKQDGDIPTGTVASNAGVVGRNRD